MTKTPKNMKSTLYTKSLAALTAIALLAACSAKSSGDNKEALLKKLKEQQTQLAKDIKKLEEDIKKENPDKKEVRVKEVSAVAVSPAKFDYFVQTQGSVESENNILVNAKAMGVVTQVYVTEGQAVTKGQTLAQVDNSVLVQNIASMKSQLELVKAVYDRQKNLWDQKVGTEVQYLQAKTNKESLEKQLASVEEQNEMTKIKAPISGTIDEVNAKVGQSLMGPAFRIVNTADLKLVAAVSEAYVTNIKVGNIITVHMPELKRDIQARVTFVSKTIDILSRTFKVEAKLPSSDDLRPNMTATVKVIFHTEPSALVVPVNVIQTLNDEKIVYVAATRNGKEVAQKKVVKVFGVYGSKAQVEGLTDGDKVITFGYQGLNDGDLIKI